MTFQFREFYSADVEMKMRKYFESLSEKDRRRFAGIEALKLGHGGIAYLTRVFRCSRELIDRGLAELDELPDDPAGDRIRRPGGGRKPTEVQHPEVIAELEEILEDHTAGDPMRDDVYWTDLSPPQISETFETYFDRMIGSRVVQRFLDGLGYARRQIAKVLAGGESPDRDAQFCYIAELKETAFALQRPVFSIDTKKKEHLGSLYRDGRVYSIAPQLAFDHDFPTWADGVIVPHGIYDLTLNQGWLHLGLSRDTSEFACDSFELFWERDGRHLYPDTSEILLLCDGGGSNSCRKHIFKEDMQQVVNRIGVPVRIAHYPAYCSKFNPIERRMFCHVTRACQGVLFDSVETVVNLMSKTATQTGLSVIVRVMERMYEAGRNATESFKSQIASTIEFDDFLPKWNYRIVPQS